MKKICSDMSMLLKCCKGLCITLLIFNFHPVVGQSFNMTILPESSQARGSNISIHINFFSVTGFFNVYVNEPVQRNTIAQAYLPASGSCSPSPLNFAGSCSLQTAGERTQVTVLLFEVLSSYSSIIVTALGRSLNRSLNVQDCPTNTTVVGPRVMAVNYTYNKPGQFVCPAGQKLFYSNSKHGITNTVCQNDATWYGAKGLECWGDPQPTITGNFSGIEGTTIIVYCNPLNMVYPPVMNYTFVIGSIQTIKQTSSSHTFMLSRNMNTQQVYCQANTKYTQLNSTLGKSSFQTLNVTFKPYKGTTTTNCIENQQCDIQVVSNPAPGNPFLVAPAMGSFTWTVQNHPYYTFQITKPKGTYMFRVNNSVGEGMFNVTVDAKTPISPSNLPLIIGASVAGVLVIAFVIILIVVIRRRNAGKSEQEERQNPIYGSSPNAVDNGTDYAQVQKKNKKNKKEMTENIAYQPASSPDAIEDAYASVSKNEKEVKMNILYGSSTGAHASQVEDAYAEVDKGKKKKKDKTKAMKVNVAYVPTPENPDAPEEAYAEVNKDKKKKGKKGEREMKDNILYGSSQAGGSVEDAYAEVDKKKKKNAGAKQGEAGSGATYSEVSKPKNKKKDKPSSSQTPDDDPYAEVDLHGQDSSNLE